MLIQFEKRGPQDIVKLKGSLTGATAEELENAVLGKVTGPNADVVLNLSDLDYVSSAGIGTMVKLFKELQDRGCGMRVEDAPPRIRTLCDIAGLTQLVPFTERKQNA